MSQGGARPGSGRKKGSMNETTRIALALRQKFAQSVERRWKEIETATYDIALGHWYEKDMGQGVKKIYQKSPDSYMLKYMNEQIIGKAKETLEVDSPGLNTELKELNEKLGKVFEDVKNSRTGI
jgi:hypothetical protein